LQLSPPAAAPAHRHGTALLLVDRAREAEAPVVYVNDNWGHWRSQQSELVQRAIDGTPLEMLLECLGVTRLVLAGTTTNSCVWFTAADAHVRGYRIVAAADATVATEDELERCSLYLMRSTLGAEVLPAGHIHFTARQD
jgi:nicotinamidase-related amidase